MLGDDVVDLEDPETAEGAPHPRFDARVFGDAELRALARARDPRRLRWRLWSAKEAAYKLARRLDPAARFRPRELEVEPGRRARLWHRGHALDVVWRDTSSAIHAVARCSQDAGADVLAGTARLRRCDSPSAAARALARRRIAAHLGVDVARLAVECDGRLPVLTLDGARLAATLSLSHHGAAVSFACRLPTRGPGNAPA